MKLRRHHHRHVWSVLAVQPDNSILADKSNVLQACGCGAIRTKRVRGRWTTAEVVSLTDADVERLLR